MKNELAGDLVLAATKSQYDACCKRILANKIILAWILKYVTDEFADMSVDEIKKMHRTGCTDIRGECSARQDKYAGTGEDHRGSAGRCGSR